jgi:hypothetical protein
MTSYLYLLPLLLYYPVIIPNVDTQPLIMALVALGGILFGRNRRAPLSYSILAVFLVLLIIIKVVLEGNSASPFSLLPILVGPLFLFGALGLRALPPSRNLMAGIAIYFIIVALLQVFLPFAYEVISTTLLNRSTSADGHRGLSLLTPEPTYAAISCMYFLMLAWWSGRHWGFRHKWIEPSLVLCVLATGSTYLALLFLALAFVRWPRGTLFLTVASIYIVPLADISALGNEDSVRSVVAVSRLLSSDFSNFLPSISAIDSSLGSRITTGVASYFTPYYNPLGLGLDCEAVPSAYMASGFEFAFSNDVLSGVLESGCLRPQSYMSSVALGLGSLSILFFSLLYVALKYTNQNYNLKTWNYPLALAFVILFVQGQITSPIPWFLIFMAFADYRGHSGTSFDPTSRIPSKDRIQK